MAGAKCAVVQTNGWIGTADTWKHARFNMLAHWSQMTVGSGATGINLRKLALALYDGTALGAFNGADVDKAGGIMHCNLLAYPLDGSDCHGTIMRKA